MKEKISEITGKKPRGEGRRFKKGESGNKKGKPVGQKAYATLYREALLKLANASEKEPGEIELELVSGAILHARKGNYKFYKDLLDRLYGTPVNRNEHEHTGKIETVQTNERPETMTSKMRDALVMFKEAKLEQLKSEIDNME